MSYFLFSTVALLLAALPAVPAAEQPSEAELAAFAIGRDAAPIVLPVTVGGKSYPFLVDTGSTFTVFDSSLAEQLGEEVERRVISTPAGPREFQFVRPGSAFVGGLPLGKESPAVLYDLTRLREASGLDIKGYLGMDYLSKYTVRVDFDRGRLSLLRSVGRDAGQRLPLKMEGGRPWVRVSLGGADPEWFLLDTGHVGLDSGRLSQGLSRRLQESGQLRPLGARLVETGGGRMEVKQGFVDSLRIGPFEHEGLLFTSTLDGNALSLEFCARYVATFDFPGGALYLRAGIRHSAKDQPGGGGLGFVRRGGRTIVEGVRDGSPAAKAGIAKGDELLAIAGCQAKDKSVVALGRLLCGSGRAVRLQVRHEGEDREVVLHLDGNWRNAANGH